MLLEPNRCFTSPPEGAPPSPQTGHLDPSRRRVLQGLGSRAFRNVVFSCAWAVMAPMGRLVTCFWPPIEICSTVDRRPGIRSYHTSAFGAKSLFYLTPERPALAADRASWTPRTYVLQCLGSWAIKNVVFSNVWGVMAPMGKLVTCLGRLGSQNRIKGSRRVCFGGHCLLFFLTRTISWA